MSQELKTTMLKETLLDIGIKEKAPIDRSMCKKQIINTILENRRK